jgi:hypothetical protein
MSTARPTVIGRNKLTWRESGSGFALYLGGSPVAHVVPDAVHAGMWRVRRPNGFLSDMVNLTRARDAAEALALASRYRRQEAQETPSEGPPVAANDFPGPEARRKATNGGAS